MPMFNRQNDFSLQMPWWYNPNAVGVVGTVPSHFTNPSGYMQATANAVGNSQDTPVEMPAQEISYDDNLLTGLSDIDLDYLRQLKMIKDQNQFNLAQQNEYRNWLESMSNTAYQRQSADLRAAGYNPALMLSAGGASVPSSGYSESAGGSIPTSATGYSLKQNNQILNWLKYALQQDKYELNKNVQTSKEIRNWFTLFSDLINSFSGREAFTDILSALGKKKQK